MKYITNYIKTKGKYKTNWYKPKGERRNGTKWQIFKWGVFLHVAMALIAEKGLNPPIIDLLNQNSQKRNSTEGSFIFLNTSTFFITLIFFFFWLPSMVLKTFQKLQHDRTNELQAVGRGNHKFKNSWFLWTMLSITYQGKLITKWIAWLTLGLRPKSNSNLSPIGHKFNHAGHTL